MTTSTPVQTAPLAAERLCKRFGKDEVLHDVAFQLEPGQIVGLVGRNGAGKSTLLNLASGLLLPTSGACRTLGVPANHLGDAELARLGIVQQESTAMTWMTVRQHLDFVGSFYGAWDDAFEKRLLEELELDANKRIAHLSVGDVQKVSLVGALCYRPSLLLLDEPMSALDPIVRERLLTVLMDLLRETGCTIVISSHILTDIEKIVGWVLCLDRGRLVENSSFDSLRESFAEWTLTAPAGGLAERFPEPYVLEASGGGRQARLKVRCEDPGEAEQFAARHGAQVAVRPLNLEEIFPLLLGRGGRP